MIKEKFFGTDGIRGKVGQSPLTADFILKLANSVGCILKETQSKPVVAIGKDTRISGYMFESALEAGFNSAGVDVILLGPLPTPGIAYLTKTMRLSLGVVISASHNGFEDNGIKFFSPSGTKLPDEWETEVERRLNKSPAWVNTNELGKTVYSSSAHGRYVEFCKSTFNSDLSLRGLRLVIDAAHGAAYKVAPKVFFELGAEVISVANEPDGFNINAGVGATNPNFIAQQVQLHKGDFGISFDGDADRLQMADSNGRIFNGDELLYLMALDAKKTGQQINGVVGTLMTNMAVEIALKSHNIELARSNVGDRHVLEELHKKSWFLGGESSGHLLDLRKHSTGDAIISALQVLQACVRYDKNLADSIDGLQLFPQKLLNIKLSSKNYNWQQDQQLLNCTEQLTNQLADNGRILIRVSGTEPLIRVMVEAKDDKICCAMAQQLAEIIKNNQP